MTAIGPAAHVWLLHKMLPNAFAFFHTFCQKIRGVPLRISLFLLDFRVFACAIRVDIHQIWTDFHVFRLEFRGVPLRISSYFDRFRCSSLDPI